MRRQIVKQARRARRVLRVRKKVLGTPARPRLAVTRSLRQISAQIIDDLAGKTICSVTSMSKGIRGQLSNDGGNIEAAKIIGKALGEKAKSLGITAVAFDRRGARYHGRIKAVADAAREAGLEF